MRKLVYYIATTIDGYIGGPDGDAQFFDNQPETVAALFERYPETCPAHLREYFQLDWEPARFDTVILGARTHQPALDAGLTSAYPHLRQLVVTHSELPEDPAVERVSGDVAALVAELKQEPGRDLWLCGGGNIAAQLRDEIDEIQIKINPVLIGAGTPLIAGEFDVSRWELTTTEAIPGGVTLLTFVRS